MLGAITPPAPGTHTQLRDKRKVRYAPKSRRELNLMRSGYCTTPLAYLRGYVQSTCERCVEMNEK